MWKKEFENKNKTNPNNIRSKKKFEMSFASTNTNDDHMNKYQRMLKDTMLIKQIGEGFGGGRVYKALENNITNPVAVKVVDLSDETGNVESSNEGLISYELRHENIVPTHRYYKRDNVLILHMEYLQGISLSDQLQKYGEIDLVTVQNIINGVRGAVQYMHSNNVTHGDIHQGNVFIEDSGGIKLIDFGCTRKHERSSKFSEECKRKDMDQIVRLENHILEFMF